MNKVSNKVLCLFIATIIVFSSCFTGVWADELPEEILIATENFEDNVDMTKWSIAAGNRTNIDAFAVVPEPGNESNKVIQLTYKGDRAVSGGSTFFQYDFTDVPNSGKLMISYKVKMVDSSTVILNNYPNVFMLSSAATGTGTVTNSSTALYNNGSAAAGGASGAKADGTASGTVNIGAGFGSTWSNILCIVDYTTKEVKYYREGVAILPVDKSPLYLNGAPSFDKAVRIRFLMRETSSWDGAKPDANMYVDDIVIKRVPQLTVGTAFDTQNVDPVKPIELDFSTPITKASLTSAVIIKENGTAIENPLMIDLSGDGKKATITPAGFLKYGSSYQLEIADTLRDTYGQTIPAAYVFPFTTKIAKGIHIADGFVVSPQDENGNATTLAGAKKIVAKITVNNPTDAAANAWVVVGAYGDNNLFLGIDSKTFTQIEAGANTGEQEFVLENLPSGTKTVRVFLWDDQNNFTVAQLPVIYQ